MTEYVYIDGGYLRDQLKSYSERYFGGSRIELRYDHFFTKFQEKFYYDCLPPQKDGEDNSSFEERCETKQAEFNELRTLPGFHVFEGKMAGTGGKARQKGVDV